MSHQAWLAKSHPIAVDALWEGDRFRVGSHAGYYARLSARPARVDPLWWAAHTR